jgi:hypothetical protein
MLSLSVWRPKLVLKPSRLERVRRCALVILSCASLLISAMPWPQLIMAMLIAVLLIGLLVKSPYSEQQLFSLQQTATEWRITLADGEWLLAKLDGPVRDWGVLLCLQFKEKDPMQGRRARTWSLLLWQDQVPVQDWRRLRVSLRWRHASTGGQGTKMVSVVSASRSG